MSVQRETEHSEKAGSPKKKASYNKQN